jgi:tetratricopeptide (TPR) repeat protein
MPRKPSHKRHSPGREVAHKGAPPDIDPTPGVRRRWILLAALVIVAAGASAYSDSFGGPFIYDGMESITNNPYVRRLWPLSYSLQSPPQSTVSGRPLVSLSLAVNYAVSGYDVWSYHAFNLSVHLLAALVLFGVIRRTLLTRRLRDTFGRHATALAGACGVLWAVHPLNTGAVTYVVQRAESMVGLFYLLTLYCAIRGFSSRRSHWWYAASAAVCLAGMATKEVMATAPLVVLVYDRVFVARSWRHVASRRWGYYLALAATWGLLAALIGSGPRSASTGSGMRSFTRWDYLATQCKYIVHYVGLAFWPAPLVLSYTRKAVTSFAQYGAQGVALLAVLAATVVALWKRPAWGFLGAWFFIILAPTSSFVPIADPAFEHRMYLPLAAIIAAVVLGGYAAAGLLARHKALARAAGIVLASAAAVCLGVTTHERNKVYRESVTIWEDTVKKQPDNFMAWSSLAAAYANVHKDAQAIDAAGRAIELNPGIQHAYNSRAISYLNQGKLDAAIADFTSAVRVAPTYASGFMGRAEAYRRKGEIDKAVADCTTSIDLNPRDATAYLVRAYCWSMKGEHRKVIDDASASLLLQPRSAQTLVLRAQAFEKVGEPRKAIDDASAALRLQPGNTQAMLARARAFESAGDRPLAVADLRRLLTVEPDNAEAKASLARLGDGR